MLIKYQLINTLFLTSKQAPMIPALSPNLDIFREESLLTRLSEYLFIALLIGKRI